MGIQGTVLRASAAALVGGLLAATSAQAALPQTATRESSAATGKLRFAAAAPGETLNAAPPAGATPAAAGKAYLEDQAAGFGLTGSQLSAERTSALPDGGHSVRFQQTIGGVPVLGGQLNVHLDGADNVTAVAGEAEPDAGVDTTATVSAESARAAALAAVGGAGLAAADQGLRVYDNRLTGGAGADAPVLVRAVEVSNGLDVRELVLVDAHSGRVVHTIQEIEGALARRVCNGRNLDNEQIPCSDPVLTEGGTYSGDLADVDPAYTYLGATYAYYSSRFGRDSVDGHGLRLDATVRACVPGSECPWKNARWDGQQMLFGDHYASADDVVGHELTHGVTQYTSGLLYQDESGAINESMSDVFGELVDQATASPDDGSGDLWEIGESLPIGAIRDMADPGRFNQPATMHDDHYYTGDDQDHLVHTNSGVGNHAAYLIAHGGSQGGQQIAGIGNEKMARIFYLVQTAYLTEGSDYADLGTSLRAACDELTGTHGITGHDCLQVRYAVLATGMAPAESLQARLELPAGGVRAGVAFNAIGDGSVPGEHPIASYAWTFSDGGTSAGANPSHTFAQPGPASATLTVTDSEGSTSTVTRAFTVRRADSAFVDLPGCADNALARNDDGYTDRVALPFTLDFFGQQHDSLYVNNNGNVTFDAPLSTYTPFNLGTTAHAIIAPFFADVDTRAAGSDLVRYGRTTFAGRPAFCVNWDGVAGVGYYDSRDDKLNRFQLLLVDRSDIGTGDFDIYFDYDQILWETGSASGGVNGFGGAPARAGFANGTQAAGTTFEIPGAATAGAYLDGASTGLAHTSLNSTVPGRFVFSVRNGLPPGTARIHGQVLNPSPVAGVLVQVCKHGTSECTVTRSDDEGDYSAIGLGEGDYDVTAHPGTLDFTHVAGTVAGVHVAAGADVEQDVTLTPLLGAPPSGTTIAHGSSLPGGTPILAWGSGIRLETAGCPEGTASYTVTYLGTVVRQGALAPVAGQPGHFAGTIAPLEPLVGYATVGVAVSNCDDPGTDRIASFGVWIDPSGVVLTTDGDPVPGATVTLLRSDASSGPFEIVPDGSDIMSPSNRANPSTTDDRGRFGWDVIAGYYQVEAEHAGCHAAGSDAPSAITGVLTIPPPVTGLELRLACDATASAPAAQDLGSAAVGDAVERDVTLSTSGLGRVRPTGVEVAGDGDFTIAASTCTGALAPGGSCHVTVRFAPAAAGARTARLVFHAGGTQAVALSGTGTAAPLGNPAPAAPAVTPPALDKAPPAAALAGARRQKLGKRITLRVTCPAEPCAARAGGTIKVGKRTFRLRAVKRSLAAGKRATLALTLPAAARRAIRRALKAHRAVRAALKVTVTDAAGNARTLGRTVRLRR